MNRQKLERLKKKALSDEEIFNALNGHTKIYLYGDILDVKNIDELFGTYDSVVILCYHTGNNM